MNALSDLEFFVRAGRAASLSEAARALGVTPAAASAAIKRLEADLGVRLMVRSTRNLRLSTEGEAFLIRCEQGLAIINSARENLMAGRDLIQGRLQLSMPSDLGRHVLLPWLQEFRQLYPKVELRLQISDRLAGIYREQVDVALRYGEPPDSNLVRLPVAPDNVRVLCASPEYVARQGAPSSPAELVRHNCLCFMLSESTHNRWSFGRGGEPVTVEVSGDIQCDDGDAVRRFALMGAGIAYKSHLDVAQDLRNGALVALCPDWTGEPAPLYFACADRSQLRPAVRRLRDFLVERIGTLA